MLPETQRHGTTLGYRIDGCRCDRCRFAVARDMKVYELRRIANGGKPLMVDPVGSLRRVRALMALGWPRRVIAVEAGYSPGGLTGLLSGRRTRVTVEFRDRISSTYDRLSMTLGPSVRTRNIAAVKGWAPPLAWTNIDDPDERPAIARDKWDESSIDDAVIDRVLAGGKRPRKLTHAEAGEIVARSIARGMSGNQIEALYGLKPERYVRGGERVA